jgi:hypothetical protein
MIDVPVSDKFPAHINRSSYLANRYPRIIPDMVAIIILRTYLPIEFLMLYHH